MGRRSAAKTWIGPWSIRATVTADESDYIPDVKADLGDVHFVSIEQGISELPLAILA